MLNIKLIDKIPHKEIREKTRVIDIPKFITRQKWRWAGHVERCQDNRWTKRCTNWRPTGKRSRGRPSRRWEDDIQEKMGDDWREVTNNRDEWRVATEGIIQQWMYDA